MRTVIVDLLGAERKFCFSLAANLEIERRWGNLQGWYKIVAGKHPENRVAAVAEMAQILTEAGARLDEQRGLPPHEPLRLAPETMADQMDPWEYLRLQQAVADALSNGNRREVGAEPPKNAVAAPGGAAT